MGRIRLVQETDAARLAEIQLPYIRDTAICFFQTLPTEEIYIAKIRDHLPHYPFIVYEEDGRILGFAYASRLREQEAYQWDVENTIYLDQAHCHRGIGKQLYRALLNLLDAQGFLSSYGNITQPNPASMALHEAFGFRKVGEFPRSGWKLGQWHSIAWLLRQPEILPQDPQPPVDVVSLPPELLEQLMNPEE